MHQYASRATHVLQANKASATLLRITVQEIARACVSRNSTSRKQQISGAADATIHSAKQTFTSMLSLYPAMELIRWNEGMIRIIRIIRSRSKVYSGNKSKSLSDCAPTKHPTCRASAGKSHLIQRASFMLRYIALTGYAG